MELLGTCDSEKVRWANKKNCFMCDQTDIPEGVHETLWRRPPAAP